MIRLDILCDIVCDSFLDILLIGSAQQFGPMAYPIQKISEMNNSNAELWFLTTGFSPFPKSLVPAW